MVPMMKVVSGWEGRSHVQHYTRDAISNDDIPGEKDVMEFDHIALQVPP